MSTKTEKARETSVAKLSKNEQTSVKRHVNTLESEEGRKYDGKRIKKVEKDVPNKCLNVHFANGE